jgi:hypothetical protein
MLQYSSIIIHYATTDYITLKHLALKSFVSSWDRPGLLDAHNAHKQLEGGQPFPSIRDLNWAKNIRTASTFEPMYYAVCFALQDFES